jgi:hypothetical protein
MNDQNLEPVYEIEQALHEHPHCATCGEPTQVVARDGIIWLECIALDEPRPLLLRLLSGRSGHIRRMILREPAAA